MSLSFDTNYPRFGQLSGYLKIVVTLFILCFAVAGFTQDSDSEEDSTTMKEKALNAWHSIKDYTHDKKEDLAASTSELLQKTDERIEALEAKMNEEWDSLSEASREKSQQALAALKEKRAQAGALWEELKQSSAETWDDTKETFGDHYQNMVDEYHAIFDEVDSDNDS